LRGFLYESAGVQWKDCIMNKEENNLRLLSIFHYIVGLIAVVFALFPLIHLVIGIAMVTGCFEDNSGQGPPAFMGYMFITMSLAFIFAGWVFAILLIVAGRFLSKRKHYMFCLVMAAISCIFMPFGTILGIFTIIVLMQPSVKQLFGVAQNIHPAP
jgi:hypothetical protein